MKQTPSERAYVARGDASAGQVVEQPNSPSRMSTGAVTLLLVLQGCSVIAVMVRDLTTTCNQVVQR